VFGGESIIIMPTANIRSRKTITTQEIIIFIKYALSFDRFDRFFKNNTRKQIVIYIYFSVSQ